MDFFQVDGVTLDDMFRDDEQQASGHGRGMYMQRVEFRAQRAAPYPVGGAGRGRGGRGRGGRGRGGRQRPALQRLAQRLDDAPPPDVHIYDDDGGGASDGDGDETMQMVLPPPRQIQRLMEPPRTADDEQYQVNNDQFRFRFKPVPHPTRLRQIEAAKTSDLVEQCFLCRVKSNTLGDSAAIIEGDKVTELQTYIAKKKDRIPREMLAAEVYERFNRDIRRPANSRRREGQEPIPDWPFESILDDLSGHEGVTESLIDSMIQVQRNKMHFAADNGMFQLPANWPPDRPYSSSDLRLNEKMAKVVDDSTNRIMQLIVLKAKMPADSAAKEGGGEGGPTGHQTYFDRQPVKRLY